MVESMSVERRREKSRSRLEHRIVVFNKTEKNDRRCARKSFTLTKNKIAYLTNMNSVSTWGKDVHHFLPAYQAAYPIRIAYNSLLLCSKYLICNDQRWVFR